MVTKKTVLLKQFIELPYDDKFYIIFIILVLAIIISGLLEVVT